MWVNLEHGLPFVFTRLEYYVSPLVCEFMIVKISCKTCKYNYDMSAVC